jgi:glycosyltransferase involved in cell wall biosynthesis
MKKLMIFSISLGTNFNDVSEKSQIWSFRYYESYFDEVYYVLLGVKSYPTYKVGMTTCLSFGTGNTKMDLLLAPFRLFKIAKEIRPTTYMTYEIVFGWWVAILIKFFLRAKIYLLPYTIPEIVYKVTGKSISTVLPIWLERYVVKLNYWFVDNVITSKGLGSYVEWLSSEPIANRKLIVVDTLPESTSPPYFLEKVKTAKNNLPKEQLLNDTSKFKLVYVGRLHEQKLVDHLIKMMAFLKGKISAHLYLIGAGGEQENLEKMAEELGVADSISFLGYVNNGNLPDYLLQADVFVSPLTSNSFREAAYCGLPIIAYDMDWVRNLPNKESAFVIVPEGDYEAMGNAVIRLEQDRNLHHQISQNVEALAWELWSPTRMKNSLQKVFEN